MDSTIYLDYNATTPLDDTVSSHMMLVGQRFWTNPSSAYDHGHV